MSQLRNDLRWTASVRSMSRKTACKANLHSFVDVYISKPFSYLKFEKPWNKLVKWIFYFLQKYKYIYQQLYIFYKCDTHNKQLLSVASLVSTYWSTFATHQRVLRGNCNCRYRSTDLIWISQSYNKYKRDRWWILTCRARWICYFSQSWVWCNRREENPTK